VFPWGHTHENVAAAFYTHRNVATAFVTFAGALRIINFITFSR
jgi:hypothetical protein